MSRLSLRPRNIVLLRPTTAPCRRNAHWLCLYQIYARLWDRDRGRWGVIWPHIEGEPGHSPGATRAVGSRRGDRRGIDGIAVGLNAIGLLCIGARNDYVCRAAMSPLT